MGSGVTVRAAATSLLHRVMPVLAAVMLAGFIPVSAQARQATPADTVDRLHAMLLGVMQQARALGFDGRYNALAPTVIESFNLPLMARVTVGRHWNRLNEQQRTEFVDAFTQMTLVTYASRFDDYAGERFEFVAQDQTAKSVVIKTRLVKADGDTVRLDYMLRQFDDGWRIIDVLSKGSYSELATRRSEYSSIIKREGFPALMSKLHQKVAELVQKGRVQ